MAVKPGMPTIGALYQDKVMICLSGNPYGAAVNLELIARTVLAKMPGGPLCACFLPGWHVCAANGSNASGIISNLSGCNCLIEIQAGTSEVRSGDQVSVVLFA